MALGAASSTSQPVASRVTAVVDAEGRVVLHYPAVTSVGTHPATVLEDWKKR